MTAKRRQVPRSSTPTDDSDIINSFRTGTALKSKKSKEQLSRLHDRDQEKLSEVHDDPIFSSNYDIDSVYLEYIKPQEDNPRYLPVKRTQNGTKEEIDALENCVVCEKGVLENRLPETDPRFESINKAIEDILLMANTLRTSDLIHQITVWRANTTAYPIVAGHIRYYAVTYLYGRKLKIRCKIYSKKPQNLNVLRHSENFLKTTLHPADALRSFNAAIEEILASKDLERDSLELRKVACKLLGTSVTTYYRYNRLAPYKDVVLAILEQDVLTSLKSVNDAISAFNKALNKNSDNESTDNIDKTIEYLSLVLKKKKVLDPFKYLNPEKEKAGRPSKYINFPKIKVNEGHKIKLLLQNDMTTIDCGIDWDNLDYDSPAELQKAIAKLIKALPTN